VYKSALEAVLRCLFHVLQDEPLVLPAKVPNLLVNGTQVRLPCWRVCQSAASERVTQAVPQQAEFVVSHHTHIFTAQAVDDHVMAVNK
jgi:hypothetical protein